MFENDLMLILIHIKKRDFLTNDVKVSSTTVLKMLHIFSLTKRYILGQNKVTGPNFNMSDIQGHNFHDALRIQTTLYKLHSEETLMLVGPLPGPCR